MYNVTFIKFNYLLYSYYISFDNQVGRDSGTTAIISVIQNNKLYVANVGDSRCVLCRGGNALGLSTDHKPEDTEEYSRIQKAGAKVTADGRVNGGLNLSRAIGNATSICMKHLLLSGVAWTGV